MLDSLKDGLIKGIMRGPGGTEIDNKAVEFLVGAAFFVLATGAAVGVKKLSERAKHAEFLGNKFKFSDNPKEK